MPDSAWTSLTDDHLARAEQAVDALAPRWTIRLLTTLMQGPLRFTDLVRAHPGLAVTNAGPKLQRMCGDGLITRTRHGDSVIYALALPTRVIDQAHTALATWAADHLPAADRPSTHTERVERAVAVVHHRHALATLRTVAQRQPAQVSEIRARLGYPLAPVSLTYRLTQLQADGLLARHGSGPHAALTLTEAAAALPAVLTTLATVSAGQRTRVAPPTQRAHPHRTATAPAADGDHPLVPPPYRPTELFSHPAPPLVPATHPTLPATRNRG
ncbi:winged helix-turn-helix transcriptional regulator [Streptomyces sp. 4N509B]|uniref:winged helix-turn-helix transcriptional regulator n=1 Tax=Streptomyces sp. 4N509B TaxID=3457413 RepID=UPI003FD33517